MEYICPMHSKIKSDKPGNCPECGMVLVPESKDVKPEHKEHSDHAHHEGAEQDFKRRFFLVLILTFPILILSEAIQRWLGYTLEFSGSNLVLFLFSSIVVLFGGLPFFRGALTEIKRGAYGMMTLVSLALGVGYLYSLGTTFFIPGEPFYWEITTLTLVLLLGHWLEMRAVRGTTGALKELAKLIPPKVNLIKGRKIIETMAEKLKKGNQVLVKPGGRIPIDGIIVEGESSVVEAMITGESKPVFKKKGDEVIGGTINQEGSLKVQVTRTGEETAIAQITKLVRQAQMSKPRSQRLADRAAHYLTVTAVVVGFSTFFYWSLLAGAGALFALTLSIAVVVIACPHALGLAIPTVTTITSTLAAQNGILVKEMDAFEAASSLDWVVFDKTGTLTEGKFGVTNLISTRDVPEEELLKLAAAVENYSSHVIAKAIIAEAEKRKIKVPRSMKFKYIAGKGGKARVGGEEILVGNKALMEENKVSLEKMEGSFKSADLKGKTLAFVARDGEPLGVIVLADLIKESSYEAVQRLKKLEIKVAMLTGDNKEVAEYVAEKLGIDAYFAEVLPEEKIEKVRELQKDGATVAMVGDGVNDAPAITQSNVGIAIGAGTDVAVEAGDIILVKNNPLDVAKLITLSKKTGTKMKQNLAWATGYNIIAIPVAAGILSPWGVFLRPEWGALLMSTSSVVVVVNALLLRRVRLS